MSGINESISDIILVIPADDDYNTIEIQNMYEFMMDNQIDVLCPDRFIKKLNYKRTFY